MIEKLKQFIRSHERMMNFLSAVYRFCGFNRICGRKGLMLNWKGVFAKKTKVINHGKDNSLVFEKGCRIYNSVIQFDGDCNRLIIARDCVLQDVDILVSDGGVVEIGHNTHFTGYIHIACIEKRKVHIGDKYLFSE